LGLAIGYMAGSGNSIHEKQDDYLISAAFIRI